MIGERCATCEFYPREHSILKCTVPQWVPKKNVAKMEKRIPSDCPRKKSLNKK